MIDLILCGIAYVVLIYFVANMTRGRLIDDRKTEDDEGDGGVEDLTPPKIDLPPGVVWPIDQPVNKQRPCSPIEV